MFKKVIKPMSHINLKQAVFTTSRVITEKLPIIYVSHDGDGAWQFFSQEDVSLSEARIVALGEIIELDKSISQILNMPVNHSAHRKDQRSAWIITSSN